MSPPFDSEIMASMHNVSTIHEIKVCNDFQFLSKWLNNMLPIELVNEKISSAPFTFRLKLVMQGLGYD